AASSESVAGSTLRVTQVGLPIGPCLGVSILKTCVLVEGALALAQLERETKSALGLDFALRVEADLLDRGPVRVFPFAAGSAAALRARVRRGDAVLWEESLVSFAVGAGVAYVWDGR